MLVEVLTQGNEALALANKDFKTFDRSSKLILTIRHLLERSKYWQSLVA